MRSDRAIGLELRDGHDIGRDPRGMTADELAAAGHLRMNAQKALRLRCIDCSGASAAAVRAWRTRSTRRRHGSRCVIACDAKQVDDVRYQVVAVSSAA